MWRSKLPTNREARFFILYLHLCMLWPSGPFMDAKRAITRIAPTAPRARSSVIAGVFILRGARFPIMRVSLKPQFHERAKRQFLATERSKTL